MKTEYTNQLQRDMGGGLGGTPIKTASTILFEYGIDIMKMDDDFNSQLLFAIERYAEQFKPTPSSTVDKKQTKAGFAVQVLQEYSEKEHTSVRHTHDLSPLEEWLILELKTAKEGLHFNAKINVDLIRKNHELTTSQKGLEELIEVLKSMPKPVDGCCDYERGLYDSSQAVLLKATELLNKK